jgi:hypothetical protein
MVANLKEMAKKAKQKQYRENAKQRKKAAKEAAAMKEGVMVASGSHKEKRHAEVTDDEITDADIPVPKRK